LTRPPPARPLHPPSKATQVPEAGRPFPMGSYVTMSEAMAGFDKGSPCISSKSIFGRTSISKVHFLRSLPCPPPPNTSSRVGRA
jgi:hypothetical protein